MGDPPFRASIPFLDRRTAGAALAAALLVRPHDVGRDPVVLALPRGGVPVGAVVADALHAALDVIVVRKLGVPGHSELAMGAIGEGGVRILDSHIVESLRVDDRAIAAVEARERGELERRVARLRGGRAARSLSGRTAVIVDDGLATGSTARAAIAVARRYGVTRVVLAVPVAPAEAADELTGVADAVVVVATPDHFDAVGRWYVDFSPTTDDDVVRILSRSR